MNDSHTKLMTLLMGVGLSLMAGDAKAATVDLDETNDPTISQHVMTIAPMDDAFHEELVNGGCGNSGCGNGACSN